MAHSTRGYRLLIVDDDAVDRQLYGRLLARRGADACQIVQSANGAAGLATLRAGKFDCVLLDFNLPDMTGLEFLAAASVEGGLPCAVVLVTGQGNEAIAVEAMKRGAQDYLVKDQVNASSLWRAVTQAVTQTELHQRLACSLRELKEANLALEKEVAIRTAAETELRRAKDAAEQANQAKTRFVAMVTHELRTPLNGILGYAQLFRIDGGLSARQDRHVTAMLQAGRHLLEMIERVLDFATIETGRMQFQPAVVPVRDLTEGCVAFIRPMASDRALALRVVHAHDAPPQIMADPARLRQVLLNLLGNAVKYTDTGSIELRVLAGIAPGALRIEVADTGRGISSASRDRLFQDFERLDAATSVEGAGLGLAIAARIIRLMGGTIDQTANPDGGSIFWFELPAAGPAAQDAAFAPPAAAAMDKTAGWRPRHLLLVDDIAMNRDVIGAFLDAAGHTVVQAESGSRAIQLASGQMFDLILMDVRMPGIDGLEATRWIRALPGRAGQVPILALTAHTFPDQVAQCVAAGMDGHVGKPVDYESLMRAIDHAIAGVPALSAKDEPASQGAEPGADPAADQAADQAADLGADRRIVERGTEVKADELPSRRFDRDVLDQMCRFMPQDKIVTSLGLLRERKEEMLRLLDQRADAALLAEVAHMLASAAGMFGFVAVSRVAREFEYVVTRKPKLAGPIAKQLRVETGAALAELDELLREGWMLPA